LSEKLKKLFQPIRIGSLELPNRIIMPAITTNYDFDKVDRLVGFYAERAKGGVGLIITGALQTLYPGRRSHVSRTQIDDDHDIPKLREWTKAIHDNGGRVAAQLATYGYWAKKREESTPEDVGPSDVSIPTNGIHPNFSRAEFVPRTRPLTTKEILTIEEAVGDAAVRARESGFDGVELQAVRGNLFVRFINPFTNRRIDEYGGTLENRVRILTETINNIKKKVGKDFPLICRIPGTEMVPWGLVLDDWKQIAPMIEKAGVHALSIYPGWHETREPTHQMCVPRGAFVYLAEGIKQAVSIPVAAGNRINDPVLAERILLENKADLIAMGTPLIADPYLPNKAREGQLEDIRMCTACCNCWDDLMKGKPVTCSVNARVGKELEYPIIATKKSKKVFVIGGGPAGMEAARVASLRGHQVTLFEKEPKLGGQLLYAALPPYKEEWNTFMNHLVGQLRKLNVEVRLNEECTVRTVEEGMPDAIIVATGATPMIPNILGVDKEYVMTAIEALTRSKQVGQNVVIVGGGSIGCETAEFLFKMGKKVTILEMLDRIGADIGEWNRWVMIDRLNAAGIRVETSSKVELITEKGVRITHPNGMEEFFEADLVVIAVGMKSVNKMADELNGKVASLYKVGDCVEPHKVRQAIEGGFLAGLHV
jgi:2,4-dienoyl-CoA reductase-like NADH-dependent reductase (Old Yellow Enzyme family)/thioredoxin reductase